MHSLHQRPDLLATKPANFANNNFIRFFPRFASRIYWNILRKSICVLDCVQLSIHSTTDDENGRKISGVNHTMKLDYSILSHTDSDIMTHSVIHIHIHRRSDALYLFPLKMYSFSRINSYFSNKTSQFASFRYGQSNRTLFETTHFDFAQVGRKTSACRESISSFSIQKSH